MMRSAIEAEGFFEKRQMDRAHDGVEAAGVSMTRRDGRHLARADEASRGASSSIGWAISALRDQGMPSEEIAAILGADDPELVCRYFELHKERLEERLADQRRALDSLERLLATRSIGSTARPREKGLAGR